jgi:hypothetical protein
MQSTAFADLIRDPSLRAKEQFLARFHEPALLVESVADLPPGDLDGNVPFEMPSWWRPTPLHARSVLKDRPASPYLEHARVIWLTKTKRNPFANLISVGRAPNNDIRFALESLSKLHATFNRSGGRWYVQDHLSRNGTFVNAERLDGSAVKLLNDGDAIRFAPELRTRFFSAPALYDFLGIVTRASSGASG